MSGQSEMADFRNTFGFLLLCAGVWCSHAVSFEESGDVLCVIFWGALCHSLKFVVGVIRVCRRSTGMGYVVHRFRCLFTCGANSFSIDSYRTNGLMAVA